MYEIIKEICEIQEWSFVYARSDFQNLFEGIERKDEIHIFLDPVESEDNDNDMGVAESINYSGDFMIAFSSDIDEGDYELRYTKYIKPILDNHLKEMKKYIRCNYQGKFNLFRKIEVINALDYSFDGMIVKFNIDIEE